MNTCWPDRDGDGELDVDEFAEARRSVQAYRLRRGIAKGAGSVGALVASSSAWSALADARRDRWRGWKAANGWWLTRSNERLRRLVTHRNFERGVLLAIVANTLVLSLDRWPLAGAEVLALERANLFFAAFFAAEMAAKVLTYLLTYLFTSDLFFFYLLATYSSTRYHSHFSTCSMAAKIGGLGLAGYVSDAFNRFDCVIVLFSIVEVGMYPPAAALDGGAAAPWAGNREGAMWHGANEGSVAISGLRAFRLLRALRLLSAVPSLRQLLATVMMMLGEIGSFGVLMLVVLYVFALVGMQLLAGRMRFDAATGLAVPPPWEVAAAAAAVAANSSSSSSSSSSNISMAALVAPLVVDEPRSNCNDLLAAWMTVFQVLTAEDWPLLMYVSSLATSTFAFFYY